MSNARDRLRTAAAHVRRCGASPFLVVALTHVPFLLLLVSVLSTLLRGRLALLLAPIGIAVFLSLCVFAALPMSVALAGYFIALAKGRHPRLLSIFGVFSSVLEYRHALHTTLWAVLQALIPAALCALPLFLAPGLSPFFRRALLAVCVVSMLLVCVNRLLAYAFVGHFAWEYPYLTPREALRLSVHITRGRCLSLLARLFPLVFLLLLTAPTLGFLSLAVLPFYYALLADSYLNFKQCEGLNLPSPKEYADV